MDHKEFFERHGQDLAAHNYSVTNEELFQIFKQRLIEELRVEAVSVIKGPLEFGKMVPAIKEFILVNNAPEQSAGD